MKNSFIKFLSIAFALLLIISLVYFFSKIRNNEFFHNKNYESTKILFTAKKKGYTNIVKLDTKTKTKEIVASFPMKPVNLIISPNQNKVAFSVFQNQREHEDLVVYTMNMDGTKLTNLTKKVFDTYKESNSFSNFCFSPDSQKIAFRFELIIQNRDTSIIYLMNLDGSEVEIFHESDQNFILINQLFFEILELTKTINSTMSSNYIIKRTDGTIKSNLDTMEFLLYDKKSIGVYSWKKRIFAPLIEISDPVSVYSWSPDQKSIFYVTSSGEKINHDIYFFNTIDKSTSKITDQVPILFRSMLWAPKGQSFLFANLVKVQRDKQSSHYDKHFYELKELDLITKKFTTLLSTESLSRLEYISEEKILIVYNQYEGHWQKILNRQTKQEEEYPVSDENDMPYHWEPLVIKHNVLILANKSLQIYSTDTNQIIVSYEFLSKESNNNTTSFGLTVSPDQSILYFVKKDKMYFFTPTGTFLFEEELTPSSYRGNDNDSSFLLGFYSSPSDITYLEYVENEETMSDSFVYNSTTKKFTNLNNKLGKVKQYQVSPDQKKVAVLSLNPEETKYSVDIMDLESEKPSIKIASFPKPEKIGNTLFDFLNKSLLYSLFWSKNSQTLFFTTGGPSKDIDGKIFNILVLNRIKADGTESKTLTDLNGLSFHASISPDGKKIVYISGEDQQVNIMNIDGTRKEVIEPKDDLILYYQPKWSSDGQVITYYQMNKSNLENKLLITTPKSKIVKKIPTSVTDFYPMLDKMYPTGLFSYDSKLFAYFKRYEAESNQAMVFLHTEQDKEILLKGNTVSFRWSPTTNQLLLIESKEKNQINQLSLYDCSTNSYTPISQEIDQIFDACWSPDGRQILYSGTDSKTGQIVFKTSNPDGSNQKVLFTFGENPLERPNSIEKIEKLVWLK
jgi:Tol biopolymer transport system component